MTIVNLLKMFRRARIHLMTTPHVTLSSHTTDVLLAGGVLSYSHMLGCDLSSSIGKTMLLWQSSLFVVANKILGTGGVSDRPYRPIRPSTSPRRRWCPSGQRLLIGNHVRYCETIFRRFLHIRIFFWIPETSNWIRRRGIRLRHR
jgi:hypothetical protein